MRNRLVVLGLALAMSVVPAAAASAQADFNGTLSAGTPKFTWESSGSGAPYVLTAHANAARCIGFPPGTDCEYILLNVEAAGELSLTLDSTEGVDLEDPTGEPCPDAPCGSLQDVDGYLYKSNAAGEIQGDTLTNGEAVDGAENPNDCATTFASEACKVAVEPGFYVLEVEFYAALEAPYIGTAELLGATPPPPPPPGGEQPPPPPNPQQPPQQQPQQPQPQPQPAPAPGPPAPGSPLPATGTLTVDAAADKGKRRTAIKRGVRGRVRCSVQCKVKAVATIDKKVARKLKLGRKAIKIASGRATITKAGRIPFYLKLSKKAKRALKRKGVKKFAVKVAFTVTDSQGKQLKKITRKVTLR